MRLQRTNPMNGVTIARGEGSRGRDDRGVRMFENVDLAGLYLVVLGRGFENRSWNERIQKTTRPSLTALVKHCSMPVIPSAFHII